MSCALRTAMAALALLAGCASDDTPVVVGLAVTGPDSTAAMLVREQLAADPLPFEVEFDVEISDRSSDLEPPEVALDRAQQLIGRDGLVAVVGPLGSREALVAVPIYQSRDIPVVLPSATSDDLAELGAGVYRMVPGNDQQGVAIARFALERLAARRAVLLYLNDEYGVGLRDSISRAFERGGGQVLDRVPVSEDIGMDYGAVIAQSAVDDPGADVVFAAMRTSTEFNVLVRAVDARLGPLPVIASDGPTERATMIEGFRPERAERLYRAAFWHPSAAPESAAEFSAAYRRALQRSPTDISAKEHDALQLVIEALRVAGPSVAAIHDYLATLGRGRPAVRGVTGAIEFTSGTAGEIMIVNLGRDRVIWSEAE